MVCRLIKETLYRKIKGSKTIVTYISFIPCDVEDYIVRGLREIEEIIVAEPFTRYGWYLAIYNVMGKVERSRIIVYHNREDPRWTVSTIIHELIHKALDIKGSLLEVIVDETLAYLASYKTGFYKLYRVGDQEIIKEFASKEILVSSEENLVYEITRICLPRILASRLTIYDYREVVDKALDSLDELVRLWIKTNPSREEFISLSNTLYLIGLKPNKYGLEYTIKPVVREFKEVRKTSVRYVLEGVDKNYLEMIRVLRRVVENPAKKREILSPWWSEVKDLKEIELLEYVDPDEYFIV